MKYLNYYSKDKAFPKIINLLSKEGYSITNDNIKSWSRETMNCMDVLRGIKHVKSLGSNIVIYTNTVNLKDRLSKENDIILYDVNDLIELSLKYKDYELYDLLN